MFGGEAVISYLLRLVLLAVLATGGTAQAVICSVTATSVPLSTLYTAAANTNSIGTISGQCTKEAGDPSRPYIYISIDQGEPPAGRQMTRQGGTQLVTYNIYQGTSTAGGQWTTGAGRTYQSGSSGGVWYRMTSSASPQPFSYNYYFRAPLGQTTAPAGIYDDLLIGVTVRLSDNSRLSTGAILQTTTFGATVSIQSNCYFSTPPSTLSINYTSFMTTAATGSSAFQVSCTYNSPYTLSLDAVPPPAVASANGTALGLNYSITLSATSGTGSAAAQTYTVDGSMPAGQAGTCAGALCTATQTHTLYIGF